MERPSALTDGLPNILLGYRAARPEVNPILRFHGKYRRIPSFCQCPEWRFHLVEPEQSRFAPSESPKHPRRVWDESRQCWIEAHTLCRRADGPWAKKTGNLPTSQLLLFPTNCN